jgi:hypothetical protein
MSTFDDIDSAFLRKALPPREPKMSSIKKSDFKEGQPWWDSVQFPINTDVGLTPTHNTLLVESLTTKKTIMDWTWDGVYIEGLNSNLFMDKLNVALEEAGLDYYTATEMYVADQGHPTSVMLYGLAGAIQISLFDDRCMVEMISKELKDIAIVNDVCESCLTHTPPQGSVYMMSASPQGLKFHNIGVGGQPLERGNYEDNVLVAYDRIAGDLAAKKPKGRLSILDGAAGSGKTHCIKGLLNEVKNVIFVIIPPNFVASLAEPSFLTAIIKLHEDERNPIVFVIEDADDCLVPREEGNMSAISMMLNLGDGIIGSVLDIRIIATTNAKHGDFDAAIRRPGRLTVCQTIGALSPERATSVYRRLTGDQEFKVNIPKTLAEVYQMAYDAGWVGIKVKDTKLGFGA